MTLPAPDALRAANRRGVLALSAGMASFVTNDALVKYVSQSLPASELIFLRGVFATTLLLAIAAATGELRQWALLRDRRVLLRAGFDAFATLTYLTSLFHLPLANATAINMATPLFITLFAVMAFHERVGPGRWLAVAVGFAGVLLVVQPSGAAFNAYALLCLGGTLLHAGRDLTTRVIDRGVPSLLITLSTALAVTLLSGFWGLGHDWIAVTTGQLALLALASIFLSGGYFLLTVSMRSGEMSVIAPFRYTGLLFALVLGFAVWGDVPNLLAWGGIALLVGAGLAVLHGQRSRAVGTPAAD
ncbi:MAG TPA: DMT family transporter [Ramlibacter sp.]|jgi:drug/metabolite transporter (DMT)-like permease|uniref:DMT family transporter n=1 Tax=Ramlibacter sp. TaxID=1917967 RepID=UPI002D40634A|nr:DMT family transporter [Ramlibacter sp.]HZY18018.1 DMT family transporter [Ramlibacter sp.]